MSLDPQDVPESVRSLILARGVVPSQVGDVTPERVMAEQVATIRTPGIACTDAEDDKQVSVLTHYHPEAPSVDLVIVDHRTGQSMRAELGGYSALQLAAGLNEGGSWVFNAQQALAEAEREQSRGMRLE